MLYLILSIFSGAMISIVMRLSQGKVTSKLSMFAVNYITCAILSWGFMGFMTPFPKADGIWPSIGMGAFNGTFYMLALVLSQYNIAQNGVVLSSVFSKMGGLLIPLLVSILIFGESPTLLQFIGFVLSMISIFVLNYRKDTDGAGGKFTISLFALLVAEGCAGIMAKVFKEIGNPALSNHFLLYTFLIAFLLCVFLIAAKHERPGIPEFLYGLMIGVPNFLGARFVLRALDTVPAVVVYPSRSVGTIVVITIVGTMLFKERLSKQQIAAMGVILVSLVLLNL